MNRSNLKTTASVGRWLLAGAAFAAAATLFIFSFAWNNGFVDLDDSGYILTNRHINSLNWKTVVWAFTSFHEANWHPLTMLSLALDRRLWGLFPFGFHATNVLIHCCTVFLVCFVFRDLLTRVSGELPAAISVWFTTAGSIVAALFFGLHPLRVESVVWASERKDVLCTFFIVATLWWYLRYVSARAASSPESKTRSRAYGMVLVMAGCALMSKPAAVSLPLILLILDWFPLSRIIGRESLLAVLKEKLPLFLMALGTALLTIRAQQYPMMKAPDVDALSRFLVACKALLFYLWKMLWPTGLAPYYPHPGRVAQGRLFEFLPYAIVAGLAAAAAVIASLKRRPLFPALFLFYGVTLAPMLGVVQVGGQWMADRYSYLPALGISLLWGGGAAWITGQLWYSGRRLAALAVAGAVVCQLTVYSVMTQQQIKVWGSTETLASREIELFPDHAGAAYVARSRYRMENGRCEPALEDIDKAMSIALRNTLRDKYAPLSMARAQILICLNRTGDALAAADWAVQTASPEQLPEILEFRRTIPGHSQHPAR
ncbi:MAG: hypothetical protein M0T70_08160 [Geobacteraceae bacterium]|nr:hypothetical protein [Geobacteraceae bacterium]